jgi:hypothetical protein
LPGVAIRGQTIVALPLEELSRTIGTTVHGILGWDFLSRFLVEIDRARGRVGLFESADYTPREGATPLPLRLEANVPRLEGAVDGHAGSFLLDTGNSIPLLLHTRFAERAGFSARATDAGMSIAGIGGSAAIRETPVLSLSFGSLTFRDLTAMIAPAGTGVVALEESIGNVGVALFGDRVLALDYGAALLWVGPDGSTAATADSASAR